MLIIIYVTKRFIVSASLFSSNFGQTSKQLQFPTAKIKPKPLELKKGTQELQKSTAKQWGKIRVVVES